MSKKKFIWIAVATCVIALIYFHQDIIHKLDDADVFRIDDFHEFNADDKQNLKDILSKYDLEPISAGNFFSLRYAFSNDDMGGLVREFTCKTADFSKCTKTIYEDDGNNIHKTVKSTEQQEAKNIYNEFIELDIFDLKSIETKPLGVYLEIYNIAYLCSNLSIEVSDKKRLNRFSITPGKHNDERYAKIFNIFQTHDFLPENPKKNTSIDTDSKAIEKIQTFYSRHIFGDEFANDSVMAKYCTKELAQKLRDDYDNEFSDGGGYAVWKFRSNAQDGSDIQEVEKIEPLGDGKYLVHYNDMGNIGSHTITIVQQNGEIFFDKLD
jgi:hypothetical protein